MAIIDDWISAGDIILFIDEVHTLIGSGIAGRGNKSSGLDIANLLKPSLGRGALQVQSSTVNTFYLLMLSFEGKFWHNDKIVCCVI